VRNIRQYVCEFAGKISEVCPDANLAGNIANANHDVAVNCRGQNRSTVVIQVIPDNFDSARSPDESTRLLIVAERRALYLSDTIRDLRRNSHHRRNWATV
jgi:hypothetical protein